MAINYEVRKTWAMLFAADRTAKKRKQYYKLVSGEKFLRTFEFDEMRVFKDMRDHHLNAATERHFSNRSYRRTLDSALNKETISYASFPTFETRLRQLRHYMDSQKPRGILQLWKDKRDTLNYYTFWGVIIFGSLSIFLAFFSLAVSVAQTIASFKALNAS